MDKKILEKRKDKERQQRTRKKKRRVQEMKNQKWSRALTDEYFGKSFRRNVWPTGKEESGKKTGSKVEAEQMAEQERIMRVWTRRSNQRNERTLDRKEKRTSAENSA